jgi:hypothetical protein
MTNRQPRRARGALFVDRLLYERRPGGGRFVTFTRRAQLGLLWAFLACFALAGVSTGALVLGWHRDRAQAAAILALQAENERLGHDLAAARAAPAADAMVAERATLEIERRSVAARLEAARAEAALLAARLEAAERARDRLAGENAGLAARSRALEEELARLEDAGGADMGAMAPAGPDERLRAAETRQAALEAYLAAHAPTPPEPAPR